MKRAGAILGLLALIIAPVIASGQSIPVPIANLPAASLPLNGSSDLIIVDQGSGSYQTPVGNISPALTLRQIMAGNTAAAQTANTSDYYATNGASSGTATEADIAQIVPIAGAFKNLSVVATTAPGSGQSFVATLRIGGVSTSLTCTIGNTATSCSDASHTAAAIAGQTMDLLIVSSSGAASAFIGWGAEFDNP